MHKIRNEGRQEVRMNRSVYELTVYTKTRQVEMLNEATNFRLIAEYRRAQREAGVPTAFEWLVTRVRNWLAQPLPAVLRPQQEVPCAD